MHGLSSAYEDPTSESDTAGAARFSWGQYILTPNSRVGWRKFGQEIGANSNMSFICFVSKPQRLGKFKQATPTSNFLTPVKLMGGYVRGPRVESTRTIIAYI